MIISFSTANTRLRVIHNTFQPTDAARKSFASKGPGGGYVLHATTAVPVARGLQSGFRPTRVHHENGIGGRAYASVGETAAPVLFSWPSDERRRIIAQRGVGARARGAVHQTWGEVIVFHAQTRQLLAGPSARNSARVSSASRLGEPLHSVKFHSIACAQEKTYAGTRVRVSPTETRSV